MVKHVNQRVDAIQETVSNAMHNHHMMEFAGMALAAPALGAAMFAMGAPPAALGLLSVAVCLLFVYFILFFSVFAEFIYFFHRRQCTYYDF